MDICSAPDRPFGTLPQAHTGGYDLGRLCNVVHEQSLALGPGVYCWARVLFLGRRASARRAVFATIGIGVPGPGCEPPTGGAFRSAPRPRLYSRRQPSGTFESWDSHVGPWVEAGLSLENPIPFFVKDSPQGSPTDNRQPPSTADHCSIPFLWFRVLPMS